MPTKLWDYSNYNAPVHYLFDMVIAEYDIRRANISILREYGKLNEEKYLELYDADRMYRQYTIGCMIRDDPSIQETLNIGLEESRRKFCEILELGDGNILHIAKDAIFVVSKLIGGIPTVPEVQISRYIKFTLRGYYSNYLRLGKAIHFYHREDIGGPIYKIRGMGERAQSLHNDHFTKLILDILFMRTMNGSDAAYRKCKEIYMKMYNKELDVECYRRFDSASCFDILPISEFSTFQAMYLSKQTESILDMSYNLEIIDMIGNYLLSDLITRR